jgi:hypothetical protein
MTEFKGVFSEAAEKVGLERLIILGVYPHVYAFNVYFEHKLRF